MKSAGCRTIWFGVESGSPRVLEKLNKGITLQQAIHAFKLCREVGIKVACSFMLGTPGETLEDMYATLRFAMKLNPDWCQFNIFIACPGSILYDEVLEGGLYNRRDGFLLYVKTEDFNYESLLEIQKLFHRTFHKSPSRIVKRIVERVKSPYGWKYFINGLSRGFKAFIKGGD
jgi:anaerobic magnesium-protoporphyrin IX monomethyl ester cyclase